MSMTDQQKHDLLMEMRPEGATHDSAACMYCTVKASKEENVAESEAIFTQEQHEQLLSTAVQRASAEARAEADVDVLRLNEELKAVTEARDEMAEKLAELERTIAEREEADRLSHVAEERAAAVKSVASFNDEQIENRKESWAKMDEEDFVSYLEDIRVAASAAPAPQEEGKAPTSIFDGTRATAGEEGTEESVITAFFSKGLSVAAQS